MLGLRLSPRVCLDKGILGSNSHLAEESVRKKSRPEKKEQEKQGEKREGIGGGTFGRLE